MRASKEIKKEAKFVFIQQCDFDLIFFLHEELLPYSGKSMKVNINLKNNVFKFRIKEKVLLYL